MHGARSRRAKKSVQRQQQSPADDADQIFPGHARINGCVSMFLGGYALYPR
jgi:hypothetical protein